MNKTFWIQVMVLMAVLLISGPLLSYAAEPAAVGHQTEGQALTSETGTGWTCTYQPEGARAEYYTGRAGQLEHRAGRRDLQSRGRLECRALTGDEVRVFKGCQL